MRTWQKVTFTSEQHSAGRVICFGNNFDVLTLGEDFLPEIGVDRAGQTSLSLIENRTPRTAIIARRELLI